MERQYFPLTSSQMLMYYNWKYSKKKSIVNICSTMHFDCEIDVDLMLQAIYLGLMRNKSSRIRIHEEGKSVQQYFSEQPPKAVEVIDMSDKTEEEYEKHIEEISKMPVKDGSMDAQLYDVYMFKKPDGFYSVYFRVSHLAFDAYSLMQMSSDMLELYVALRDGKPLPTNKNNPMPAFEQDWEYTKSEKYKEDYAFWSEVFGTEAHYSTISGLDSKEWIKGKRYGKSSSVFDSTGKHINFPLSKEIAESVVAFARDRRVSPQCIYLLALRNYLSKMSGEIEDITLLNTIARRATKVQKNAGGTRVLGAYLRLNFSNELTFDEACKTMQTEQYKYYAHADLPTTHLLGILKKFGAPVLCNYCSANLTYQPFAVVQPEGLPVHFTLHSNGASNMPLYLTIMALDNSGNLNCCYEYNCRLTPKMIEKLHNYIIKFVQTAIKKPEMTLKELMNI